MTDAALIMTTTDTKEEAGALTEALLSKSLAACIQRQSIESSYIWEGAVQSEAEILLLIKTKKTLYSQVEKTILEMHSYDEPEIVMLDIEQCSAGYLSWIDAVTA